MTQENKPERIVILSKGYGVRFEKAFFLQIQEGFDNGYRIADTDLRDDTSMRNFQGRTGRAVMYLEGCEPARFVPATVEATSPEKVEIPTVKEETKEEDLSTGKAENSPVVVEKELTLLEHLEELEDYKSLKKFAEINEIKLPAKTFNPVAVKKLIKAALEA